jgi:hypothetical protein
MNESKPTQEQIDESLERVESILRHIDNVRENCILLGKKLIENGEILLGRQLIVQGLKHDTTKFFGLEWEHMDRDTAKSKLDAAILQHSSSPENRHHPEAWPDGVEEMPRLFLAEMSADWIARSGEFGTSVREWIDDGAGKRFGFKKGDRVYREIMEFVNLLCDAPFKQK